MPVGEIVIATGKTASALGSLAKSSPAVMKFLKRSYRRVTRGYVNIPIFGSGGVGKSTAAKIIAGTPPDSAYKRYEESVWTEVVPLAGDIPGELRVAPGQEARIDRHWPELFKHLSAGKAIGLINVVSYGYHALEINSVQDSSLWQNGMTVDAFRDTYTEARRQLELRLLDEVMSGLSATTSRIWMATIINKQDLWADKQPEVLKHYQSGRYAQIVERVATRLGTRGFQHEFIPTSLAIANLTTGSGQIVAESIGGYDVNARNSSLERLSQKLHLLVSQ